MTTPESTVEAVELKPCPFCGSDAAFEHSYHEDDNRYPRDFWHVRISCQGCGLQTEWTSYGDQEQETPNIHVKEQAERDEAASWNTRASLPAATEQEPHEDGEASPKALAILKRIDDAYAQHMGDPDGDYTSAARNAAALIIDGFLASPTDQAKLIDDLDRSLGCYGQAYDMAGAHRAFTYDHQPGNVEAYRLGQALGTVSALRSGDYIDTGLLLLKVLQEKGFGVFAIDNASARNGSNHNG